MIKIETGGSAFPLYNRHGDGQLFLAEIGMTLRQYAAIHLRVPNSGTDWLDDMIAKARRLDASDRAMQGLVVGVNRPDPENIAFLARKQGHALHG